MDEEIRKLLNEVTRDYLDRYLERMQQGGDPIDAKGKKSIISELNDAEKNEIERSKVDIDRQKVEIEARKIDIEEKKVENELLRIKSEHEIEQEKLKLELMKIDNEKEKIKAEMDATNEKNKWDFLGKVVTGGLTLAGSIIGLVYLNKWTKWGFIQEEFGSISGKTMNNVMREWKIKRV